MPQLDAERREVAETIRRDRGIENALTAAQARLFVRCLQTSWQVPPIAWTQRESQAQLQDALRLMHGAEIYRELEGAESPGAIECYRRAGELLEWLARAGDDVTALAPVSLYAAGAYQLGGLPAMATSLLRQAEQADGESRLYTEFLRADFDAVLSTCANFWQRHPQLTAREGSVAILTEDRDDQVAWYLVVEMVRAIGLIADSLRRGDVVRLEQATRKLKGIEALAARSTGEEAWILLSLLRATAENYASSSVYSRIERLAESTPVFESRLRRFAREQFARGRGILWTSQIRGLERLIADSSFALCTPTGSGKTLVANLALVKELLLAPAGPTVPLALYLVPSRALAGEVEAKLTTELGRDLVITGLYGGSDWGITDYWLTADRPTVLIATVEKADALLRYLGPLLLSRLRLLIIDEAHQVVSGTDQQATTSLAEHSSRSMRLESLVSRLLALNPELVRIALTAVAGGGAAPIARWVEGRDDAEAVGTRYRSTRQLIGALLGTPGQSGRMVLDLMNGRPLYVRNRDEPVYLPLRLPPMPLLPAAVRNSLNHYNELHVLWTSLHLQEGNRRILISVAQEPEVTMRWYTEAFQLSGWTGFEAFVEPQDPVLQARFREARAAAVDYCGADSYEVALLDHGIATNHGQMPQRLRRLMTDLIERRICPVTVATATLTEGVNLPFDIIFLTELKRSSYDQVANAPVTLPLSTAEFRNLAGRAGRPGSAEAVEGMTLVALPQSPSTTAATQRNTQRRQVRTLNQEYESLLDRLGADEATDATVQSPLALLLQSIAEGAVDQLGLSTEQAFLNWLEATLPEAVSPAAGTAATTREARLADTLDELDAVLLAAVEEAAAVRHSALDGAAKEAFLRDLWARSFAHVAHTQEDWLERAFIKRGRAIVERLYPNPGQRQRLYQYGFAPCIGRRFENIAVAIRSEIEAANNYGVLEPADREMIFERIADLLQGHGGFGFRVRSTVGDQALLARWRDVLAWWMQAPAGPHPEPGSLRNWQRFVGDNLEYRLGTAVGAVVAQAWSQGAPDHVQTPTLDSWTATTHLPWFGFWCRELLRWGTLDPLSAFALSQGLARTREEAAGLRPAFNAWLASNIAAAAPDDLIDPQHFLAWQRSLLRPEPVSSVAPPGPVGLTGTDGRKGRYSVMPIIEENGVTWIDAGGFSLARSAPIPGLVPEARYRDDYELTTTATPQVRRIFMAR